MGIERVSLHGQGDVLRDVDRRISRQERRPNILQASDLLGPGFAPRGVQVMDWNDDALTFGGFWWSDVGALNSPDSSSAWAGISIAETDGTHGIQAVWSQRDHDPVRHCARRWGSSADGSSRTYTAWSGSTAVKTSGITALSGCTLLGQTWQPGLETAAFRVSVQLTASIAVGGDGNIANAIPLFQLPASITPTWLQEVGGGTAGPMTWWQVQADGVVGLSSTTPGASLVSGTILTAAGTYRY